jgi:hypothetical protein
MSRFRSLLRGNFLLASASIAMVGALGCASHSGSSTASVPANPVEPSPSAVRDIGYLGASIANGGQATAVTEKSLTGGAQSRGFDFGDNGGGGGAAGPVNFDQLGQLLNQIAGHPQVNGGVYLYNIKEDSGLSYPLGVTLSQDGKAIYFLIPIVQVDPQGWANQESLLKLLLANSSICPASFAIVEQRLFLLLGVPNTNVNVDSLKTELSYLFDTVHKTQQLWGPWMQGGQQQGGSNPGGGNPGNGGGGNPGSGGSGGGSNPFGQ